ncbi:hypothetical protein TNIN_255401 [Trichonephila inaurata madagascariensis]|uniref:Uncharacterized protein n=1 Tax=Trichonephila inaurata madagascariensis TaxID=2747483 RepID=A0A8X6XBE5_9ARAC|nr:hypothetical protein TNIN_255401 [Trichonephila inaurata madagascariensis]
MHHFAANRIIKCHFRIAVSCPPFPGQACSCVNRHLSKIFLNHFHLPGKCCSSQGEGERDVRLLTSMAQAPGRTPKKRTVAESVYIKTVSISSA